ncbi:MAG: CBS domain-containing protein, partial [Dongiaceae bacterium]
MDRPPPERIDSYPYRYRVAEVMSQPPITAAPGLALAEAARRMRETGVSALVTVGADGKPQGILTERDLLMAVAERGATALSSPISDFTHAPVQAVTADDYLFTAIARMDRLRLRHLAAVDPATGVLVGIVTARVLLQQRAQEALVLGDEIAVIERAEDMAALYRRLPALAEGLLRDGMAAREIAAVLSAVLR